ncbi:MAG: helix-hairpin-helix domain-containing protein [Bacteroidota bacterium]
MNLRDLRSQCTFYHSERIGIFLLLGLLLGLLCLHFFVSFAEEDSFEIQSPTLCHLQEKMDSARAAALLSKQPMTYSFNPNFMTDYKAYTLGISPAAFDRLKAYRAQDRWVNSATEFQQVTGISDSLLDKIREQFRFPKWTGKSQGGNNGYNKLDRQLLSTEKQDLNTASSEDLQEVYGVGPALGARIIDLRNNLGGFANDHQLYAVWGLQPAVVQNILREFTVTHPGTIQQMNVNKVSASDISTTPGISFAMAKDIWEFVRVRAGIDSLAQLKKIDGITPQRFKLIELYLYAEQ